MRKRSIKPIVVLLLLAGLLPLIYKTGVLGIPVLPEHLPTSWRIEARVSFVAQDTRARLTLQIPKRHAGFQITSENYASDGFSINTGSQAENRSVTWSKKRAKGQYDLFYEVTIRPLLEMRSQATDPPDESIVFQVPAEIAGLADALLKEVPPVALHDRVQQIAQLLLSQKTSAAKSLMASKRSGSFERALRHVLSRAGIRTRKIRGFDLVEAGHNLASRAWIEIWNGTSWDEFDLERGKWGVPETYFSWWRGSQQLLRAEGVQQAHVEFSATAVDENSTSEKVAKSGEKGWALLYTLPAENQAIYKVILLIPLGGLLIAIMRNIIGIDTYGTFMPVLVALAFRETGLMWGLLLFVAVVSTGLLARLYFERLSLLLVPRLASTLTVVVILLVAVSGLATWWSIDRSPSVALFPMVIITMVIERISVQWEESGSVVALRLCVMTLFAASLVYLVITNRYMEYLFFTFPELLLVVLAGAILLGRYTGYRFVELARFRSLMEKM